jgi:hypothetical protein
MDFIEGLPVSHKFSVILVIVDRLTKYGCFLPLAHPYMAATAAQTGQHLETSWHASHYILGQRLGFREFLLAGTILSPGHHSGI